MLSAAHNHAKIKMLSKDDNQKVTTDIHRRTGWGGGGEGGEGGCSPLKFWATQLLWATWENLGKASF